MGLYLHAQGTWPAPGPPTHVSMRRSPRSVTQAQAQMRGRGAGAETVGARRRPGRARQSGPQGHPPETAFESRSAGRVALTHSGLKGEVEAGGEPQLPARGVGPAGPEGRFRWVGVGPGRGRPPAGRGGCPGTGPPSRSFPRARGLQAGPMGAEPGAG